MKTCTYSSSELNLENVSYEKLIESFTDRDLEQVLSILFSLEENKQEIIYDKLEEVRKSYEIVKPKSLIGDPDISLTDENKFTTQTFIDSGYYLDNNGNPPIFRLNDDEYAQAMIDKKVNEDHLSVEIAKEQVDQIRSSWVKIAEDTTDLHKLIVSINRDEDIRSINNRASKTNFFRVSSKLKVVHDEIMNNILHRQKGSKLLRNINLEAKLKGLDATIVGHIDYLFITPEGDIEIFNIKASTYNKSDWGNIKTEKFKHELALLKRILEYNGINAKNIRVNLIPVQIKYDSEFEDIIDISRENAISMDISDTTYTFQKYDNLAASYIESNATIEEFNDDVFDEVNKNLSKIFPGKEFNVLSKGIRESAKGWIDHNWRSIAVPAKNGEKGWLIRLPGEKDPIKINNTAVGSANQDLINLVMSREEELFGSKSYEKGTYRILADIQKSYEDGRDYFAPNSQGIVSSLLVTQLNKYFEKKLENDKYQYKWELISNNSLKHANIAVFKHKETNQIDVIVLTPYDVSKTNKINFRENLLGSYLPDLNNENFTMESNYGNIEAIRALTLLNEILPKFDFTPNLGQLKVLSISPTKVKKGCEYEFGLLLPEFDTILKVVNENYPTKIENNFRKENIEAIDPAILFIQTWKETLQENSHVTDLKSLGDYIKDKYKPDGTTIDGLESTFSVEGKIEKLELIVEKMKKMAIEQGVPLKEDKLVSAMYSTNRTVASIARVYIAALRALSIYNGDLSLNNEKFSTASEYFMRPQSIPNTNVRTVGYLFQRSINKISNTILDKYAPIKAIIMQYYQDCSGGNVSKVLGTKALLFKNLYALDPITGEKNMQFKNPYDLSTDLKPHEREFLKKILWEFHKIRSDMFGIDYVFTGPNDSKLIKAIESGSSSVHNYFNVPLERASAVTRRTNIPNAIKDFGRRWMKRIMNPKDAFKEFSENILNEDELDARNQDISNLSAYNPFHRSENVNRRENYLNKVISEIGVDYFETDVENLIIDFLEKHIQCSEYNKMLTRAKGILLDLQLRGIAEDDPKAITHTVKTIENFLSVAVYNKSIMEDVSQKFEAFLEPIRKSVTRCYIAANPVAAMRDIMNGLLENTVKTAIKFQTDLDVKDIMFGYKKVIEDAPNSVRTITILNQLNVKYRFSNLDVARISEGLKSGKHGILNVENWSFATLRGPDYLNRMVLFCARMHHDNVFEAYKLIDGQLKYDFNSDKRFEKYLKSDTSDMKEYTKQRSLYLSLLRMFNKENNTTLKEGDPLPDAYTLQQIETFKNFADNIYGAYNQSQKAKYEHVSVGRNLCVFSTWMNSVVDVYFKERQLSQSESKWVYAKNNNGEKLYFDKHGNVVTLKEGGDEKYPVMEEVPIMVQGCWYTLAQTFKELYVGIKETKNPKELWEYMQKNVWEYDINMRNYRRMFADLIVASIMAMMFKMFITPNYKEHKATSSGKNFIVNGIIEILYKSSSTCYDGFKGPLAVLDYYGNSTNPVTYKLSHKILNDSYNLFFGDKTLLETVINAQALPRSFRDTYAMWKRDNK